MLCAYVLQCGCVQCINDYGFVRCLSVFIFPCIGGSLGPVCEASVSFFSARRVYFCFILDINIALIFFFTSAICKRLLLLWRVSLLPLCLAGVCVDSEAQSSKEGK